MYNNNMVLKIVSKQKDQPHYEECIKFNHFYTNADKCVVSTRHMMSY